MRAILFSEIMLRTLISRQPPWGRTIYSVKCMQLENSGSVVKMPRHLLKIIVWAFQRTLVRLRSKNCMHYVVGHAPRMICGRACTTNDFLCMHYEWSCDLLQKLLTALECWENSVSEACAHVPNRKNLAACAREIWSTFGLLFGLLFK